MGEGEQLQTVTGHGIFITVDALLPAIYSIEKTLSI